jgi:hypothetical protein
MEEEERDKGLKMNRKPGKLVKYHGKKVVVRL